MLCGLAWAILAYDSASAASHSTSHKRMVYTWKAALESSHLILGTGLALALIVVKMHVLLPDTALAKSHGASEWRNVFSSSATVLMGALSFGVGMLLFWLLTLGLVLRFQEVSFRLIVANSVFPITILIDALRGQGIQGYRYLVWTFLFPIMWNILELAKEGVSETKAGDDPKGLRLSFVFLIAILLLEPIESKHFYRVFVGRATTFALFRSQHLETLRNEVGIAFDVGYIGYFTQARICDLAGLVNGRASARLTTPQRTRACAAQNPGFIFASASQIQMVGEYLPLADWQVCGQYNLVNLRRPDTHFLLVRPTHASEVCHAITGDDPTPLRSLDLAEPSK
jgi:hypothetical protein